MNKHYENRTLQELRKTKLYEMIPKKYKKSKLNKTQLIALFRSFRPDRFDKEKYVVMDYNEYKNNNTFNNIKYTNLPKKERHNLIRKAIYRTNGEYIYSFLLYMSNVRYPNKKDYKLFYEDALWTFINYSKTLYWFKKYITNI